MRVIHRTLLFCICLLGFLQVWAEEPAEDLTSYQALTATAEAFITEGSHEKALFIYRDLLAQELPQQDRDWVMFRLADCAWRSLAATQQSDPQIFQEHRDALKELALRLFQESQGKPPELWVKIETSLADSYWLNAQERNWSMAILHYSKVLDWWAGQTDIEPARDAYLNLIKRIVWSHRGTGAHDGHYWIPQSTVNNAVGIAKADDDVVWTQYLLARHLETQQNNPSTHVRMQDAYEQALAKAKGTEWYDDILYHYARWQQRGGQSTYNDQGVFVYRPDFERAIALYNQLLSEYAAEESQYVNDAQRQIKRLTQSSLNVYVHHSFKPGETVDFAVTWKNLGLITVNIYPIELAQIEVGKGSHSSSLAWYEHVSVDGIASLKTYEFTTDDKDRFNRAERMVQVDGGLPIGAYIVEAKSDGFVAHNYIQVTHAALVSKIDDTRIVAFYCDADSGRPIAQAAVHLWSRTKARTKERALWSQQVSSTNDKGIAVFEISGKADEHCDYWVGAQTEREGFAFVRGYYYSPSKWGLDEVYLVTDRPAYRPEETVRWKAILQTRLQGDDYRALADMELNYRILGPRGTVHHEGTVVSNAYGSVWDEIALGKDWPLGKYHIEFVYQEAGQQRSSRASALFRLEEYRLPEYKVAVSTASADFSEKQIFGFEDEVRVTVQADYYHGGPVVHADVEVVVQKEYFYWRPMWGHREGAPAWRPAEEVQRETLKTDESGRASFMLRVPGYQGDDLSFNIEARVVDASRREVFERVSIRVTRQPYFLELAADKQLYKPGEMARVTLQSVNANNQPVRARGRLRVLREALQEIWVGPNGQEITGSEFAALKSEKRGLFSRSIDPEDFQFLGYKPKTIEVANLLLSTQSDGVAEHVFEVDVEGFYRMVWVSYDSTPEPMKVEAVLWAVNHETQQIRVDGKLKIIADKHAFQPGRVAPVMIAAPAADRYVFFSVEAHTVIDYQVVHLQGNVQLLELDVSDEWVPNVFLNAVMIEDYVCHTDTVEVDIAPLHKQLNVQVMPGETEYLPQEQGVVTVEVTDVAGQPVEAEVALAVVDEAIFSIQGEMSKAIFKHFYGDHRNQHVRLATSFQQRAFKSKQGQQVEVMPQAIPEGKMAFGVIDDETLRTGQKAAEPAFRDAVAAATDGEQDKVQLPRVVVRKDFNTSIFWQPDVMTDAEGKAAVTFDFPDNLTTWQVKARAVGAESKFGEGVAMTKTRLPLIARLQAPRFFVAGDQVTIAGVFNNNSARDLLITAGLEADGVQVQGVDQLIKIPAQGMRRVDWIVDAVAPGEAVLTLKGASQKHSDGMRLTIPVYPRGIEKVLGVSAQLRPEDAELSLPLTLPPFAAASMDAYVQVSPSLTVAMLDALPYLVTYPYGCTEQTLNRFLPLVMVEHTLKNFGIQREAILGKMFGGIAEEHLPEAQEDIAKRDDMVRVGLERLYDFQRDDGSWGWWQGGSSNLYMSAYALWGLTLCDTIGIEVDADVLERGREYLTKHLVEAESDVDLQAWLLHALAARFEGVLERKPSRLEVKAFANLWKKRDELNTFTRALLALSAFYFNFAEEGRIIVDNLENGVVKFEPVMGNPAMAHWGKDRLWNRWSEGGIEATAFALMALVRLEPEHELIQPVLNWLVANRQGARWSNTRDTAITLLALNRYVKHSGELELDLEYKVMVNDTEVTMQAINRDNLLTAPSHFALAPSLLKEGDNKIVIQRTQGEGALYAALGTRFKTLEEPIQAAAHQIQVNRRYHRLASVPTLLNGFEEKKVPLLDGEFIASGERVEVVIELEGNIDLAFLMIEDLKPAGFEAVEVQSGKSLWAREVSRLEGEARAVDERVYTGRQAWVYQELRDRKVAMFIDAIDAGRWEIRYILRAEAPGVFQALPVIAQAMYVPAIRGNSQEVKVKVQ